MSVEKEDLEKLKKDIIDVIIDNTKTLGGHIKNLQNDVKKIKRRFTVIDDRLSDIEIDLLNLEKTEKNIKSKVDEWELEKIKEKTHSETDDKEDDWFSRGYC